MSAARWIVAGRAMQHRDPGCRGLDQPVSRARRLDSRAGLAPGQRDPLDSAIERGLIREVRAELADCEPCSYCHSASGYRRLPHDFPYIEHPAAA